MRDKLARLMADRNKTLTPDEELVRISRERRLRDKPRSSTRWRRGSYV